MGCVIKYKGQSIPEEQFLQYLNKQIAINQLFESDSNLANQIYEALGFGNSLSLEEVLKEYSIEDLKGGVTLKSLQNKIEEKDFETIKRAYNYLKSEEKYKSIKNSNEQIESKLEKLREELRQTKETKVGSILTITNEENDSDYKVKVIEINKHSDYAILKVKTAKNKEYTIRVESDGNTKTGYIEDFVFTATNTINAEAIKLEISNLKSQLQELKPDYSDYYVDYFENTNQITPQQKQQAQQLYSEYLDTIFPDSKVNTINTTLKANKPKTIASTIFELEPDITKEKLKTIYDNYVALMNRRREGKAISYDAFESLLKTYQVYKYKDTYIFGNYDINTATFITRINSSPSSKELLAEAIPNLVKNGLDFISFVPKDYADKLVRSGYTASVSSFNYNFKGEEMDKFAVASNPNVFKKIFNKGHDNVTSEEIEQYNHSQDLKYIPVEVNAELIKKAGKDASKIFETYLSQFGINVRDINEIKDKLEIDEIGFADLLSKIAYVKDKKDLPPVAGEFIAYMMQYNPLVKDIIMELSQTPNYKKLKKDEYFKIIGGLIADDLQNKLKGNYSKSLLDKLKQLIKDFFSLLNNTPVDLINKNIGIISNNILQQNKKLITSSLYKPGAFGKSTQQVSIEEALKKDKFGANIIYKLSKLGFILTGSTALSEQGVILRPDENPLHDIDWVSSFIRKETKEKFLKSYPDAIMVRDIYGDGYITDSYLIAPEGYSISNYKADNFDGKIIINSYDVVDSKGNVVGTYRLQKQEGNNQSEEVVTGVEGKVIDFFSYNNYSDKNPNKPFNYKSKEGTVIQLANWKDIFKAKLNFARYKDIWDYNRFMPNENVQTLSQQEQQAQQLYSQYLEQNPNGSVEQFKSWVDNNQSNVQYQLPQDREQENLFTTKINQFTYTYNPNTKEVIHNAIKGDKIEDNKTVINKVLVKYALANNYPVNEFNKQKYIKINDKVLNINNGNQVTSPNITSLFDENQENIFQNSTYQELLYKLNDIFEDRTSLIFNINNNKDFDTNSRLKAIRSLIDNKEVNYNNHLEHLEEYLELFEHLPAIHNLINKYGSKQAILEVYDNDNGSGNNNLQQEFIEAVNGLKSIFRNVNKTKLNSLENWLDKNIVDINKIDIQDKDDNVLYPTEQYSLDVNNEKFIKYYYELSGKKEDIITFAKRLKSTIATYKLLGYNNDKILEMLKCL